MTWGHTTKWGIDLPIEPRRQVKLPRVPSHPAWESTQHYVYVLEQWAKMIVREMRNVKN